MTSNLVGYRWAWAQQCSVEEKLLLLALADGDEEPMLDELATRTGLGYTATRNCAERLHKRGLIDDKLHPRLEEGEQP